VVQGREPVTISRMARWPEFTVSAVGLNERLARNRFTVPPLLLEAANSNAGAALPGINIDVRSCAHLGHNSDAEPCPLRARTGQGSSTCNSVGASLPAS
jgi:hypothetical protein